MTINDMNRLTEIQTNEELMKTMQSWQNEINKEIGGIKTFIKEEMKFCSSCGKEIRELRKSVNEVRDLLIFDAKDIAKGIRNLVKKRLISGYKRVEASDRLQKELEIWDEVESDGLDDDE